MKKIIPTILLSALLGLNATAQKKTEPKKAPQPKIVFEQDTFDFGRLKEGSPAVHLFKFTNKGKAPLIITGADKSCGCTTPTWPAEPIKPKASGAITVAYDTKSRPGYFLKTVVVHSNAGADITLYITGTVEIPPQTAP